MIQRAATLVADSALIADPAVVAWLIDERSRQPGSSRDEVWEGRYVVTPIANNEHQSIAAGLIAAFIPAAKRLGGACLGPVNVSDRDEGWLYNFRQPDVAVVMPNGAAIDRGTHFQGGPDLCVEILSRGDLAREKRPFYASIGVRELILVDRDPWALEFYRRDQSGDLAFAGRLEPSSGGEWASEVLPLRFLIGPADPRPVITVIDRASDQTWSI